MVRNRRTAGERGRGMGYDSPAGLGVASRVAHSSASGAALWSPASSSLLWASEARVPGDALPSPENLSFPFVSGPEVVLVLWGESIGVKLKLVFTFHSATLRNPLCCLVIGNPSLWNTKPRLWSISKYSLTCCLFLGCREMGCKILQALLWMNPVGCGR